jgi:ABC-type enterobactin transport system permease subunit
MKPWLSIVWFTFWGLFQTYAVGAILLGRWKAPQAFPIGAYNALVYPDMFFIPVYFATAVLLFFQHRVGFVLGLLAGGAVTYVMIYLLALAGLKGAPNLIADGLFLSINCIAVLQLACRFSKGSSAGR